MSKQVWKYEVFLSTHGTSIVTAPEALFLTVQKQGNKFMLWALVDMEVMRTLGTPKDQTTRRKVVVVGTGWPVEAGNYRYINTVFDGDYVWHAFEEVIDD